MRIFKAPRLSILQKPFVQGHDVFCVISLFSFLPFSNPREPMLEGDAWPLVQEILNDRPLDMGEPKIRGEWLANGFACAIQNEPSVSVETAITVNNKIKKLRVTGEREWLAPKKGPIRASEAKPFQAIEMLPTRTFGGSGFQDNPAGKGFWPDNIEQNYYPLPEITYLDEAMQEPKDILTPAYYCARNEMLPERQRFVGTYDEAWAETYFPGLPLDFDRRFYQVAQTDQQIDGFFKGTETFLIENMHPAHRKQSITLPGINARAFVTINRTGKEQTFEEVRFNTDTVVLFPSLEIAAIINRGMLKVESIDFHEIDSIISAFEWIEDTQRAAEYYKSRRDERLDREKGAEAFLRFSELYPIAWEEPPDPISEVIKPRDPTVTMDGTEQIDAMWAKWKPILDKGLEDIGAGNFDEFKKMVAQQPEDPALTEIRGGIEGLQRFQGKSTAEIPQFKAEADKVSAKIEDYIKYQVDAAELQARKNCAIFGHSYDEIKAMAANAVPSNMGEMKGLINAELQRIATDSRLPKEVSEAALKAIPMLDEASFDESSKEMEKMEIKARAAFGDAYPEVSPLSPAENSDLREEVSNKVSNNISMEGHSFAGADLSGLNLRGSNLAGVDFTSADLSGADLTGAIATQACFAHTTLKSTDFSSCDLSEANFGSSKIENAKFLFATLDEAVFKNTVVANSIFLNAFFEKTVFDGATFIKPKFLLGDFTEAIFKECSIVEGDFSNCKLEKTTFLVSEIVAASFLEAAGDRLSFIDSNIERSDFRLANLSKVSTHENVKANYTDFRRANLTESNLRGSSMKYADFSDAKIDKCDFSETDLYGAKFARVLGPSSRFQRANLDHVDFTGADLSEANFQYAHFVNSDAKGTNFFMVDFTYSHIKDVVFEQANISRTILDGFSFP